MSAAAKHLTTVGGVSDMGEQIRRRRVAAGFTVKALAERAGVDRGTLAAIEEGTSSARPTTVAAVLSALDAFEEETTGHYDDEVAAPKTVTLRAKSQGGFEVTVEGPVDDLDKLDAALSRLIDRMRGNGDTSQ